MVPSRKCLESEHKFTMFITVIYLNKYGTIEKVLKSEHKFTMFLSVIYLNKYGTIEKVFRI